MGFNAKLSILFLLYHNLMRSLPVKTASLYQKGSFQIVYYCFPS